MPRESLEIQSANFTIRLIWTVQTFTIRINRIALFFLTIQNIRIIWIPTKLMTIKFRFKNERISGLQASSNR